VPDAMLKTGYSHYDLGEWAKARESLNQVIARYPGTPAAKSAEQRLAKMKKEKR
jgi:TolA-binding protein